MRKCIDLAALKVSFGEKLISQLVMLRILVGNSQLAEPANVLVAELSDESFVAELSEESFEGSLTMSPSGSLDP